MVWLQFLLSAAAIVAAAVKLAEYGDVIAVRTRLGGMFIGTLLLAGATSLPELLAAVNRLGIGPAGLGGTSTALAVHVETHPCHIASLPVAVNINCHSHRHLEVLL